MKNVVKILIVLSAMAAPLLAADKPAVPGRLDLPSGFKPTEPQLEAHRYLAFPGCQGCEIGEINGLRPIYVISFKTGLLRGEPLLAGDVILAVAGEPLVTDSIAVFRAKVAASREKGAKISVTRWRAGSITNLLVNSQPEAPDLTQGDKHDDGHDWTLGPTGMRGWIWAHDSVTTGSRQILVTQVAAGSPAHGILQTNDVILGVNGHAFTNDARVEYAHAITAAEEERNGGVLRLIRWRTGQTQEVELKLPVLGSYNDTAPYDSEKGRKIFEQGCRVLARQLPDATFGEVGMITGPLNALALLASGREEYRPLLAAYAKRAAEFKADGMVTWSYGYINMFLAEYVMATGDQSVFPGMRRMALEAARGQSAIGTWGHKFARPDGGLDGYGCMNQPGLVLMISMVLARQAGVQDQDLDRAIEKGSRFLRWYVDKGVVPYGDHFTYGNHEENGKCSSAAVLFDLLGDREAATYFARMATAAHGERESGHTGNFFNILWALPGVSRGGPRATGAYLKETSWYYDLARRWDGSFVHQGIPGEHDDSYGIGRWDATGSYLLAYALPLRSLHITGKRPSVVPAFDSKMAAALIADGGDFTYATEKKCYDGRTTKQLLAGLSSWSPAVRHRSGQSLAHRNGDFVPVLLKLLDGTDRMGRYGACEALGLQGPRADAAAPRLRALLFDGDPWIQFEACLALPRLGAEVRQSCVNDLLKATVFSNPADPRQMVQRAAAIALFAPSPGSREPTPILTNSLDGVDRSLLYPAIRALLKNQDSVARGCVATVYARLTPADLAVLLPDIIPTIERMPPSNEMFADGVRLAGLDLLSRVRIREGMELCVSTMESRWGNDFQKRMEYLQRYGVHAKVLLPQLKPKRPQNEHKARIFDQLVDAIEASTNAPAIVTLQDFVGQGVRGR